MQKKHLSSLIVATYFFSYSFISFAGDATTDQAAQLLKARDYKAAYALLEPLESEKAGNVDYDYLLGVSAVEVGEASRAIFAFERVLAVQPNNQDARAMLARAYFIAGEPENAKAEFKNVQTDNLDPSISKVIKDNILAIDKATGQATTFAAYIDIGLGYDSNINSATSVGSIVAPGLAPGLVLTLNNNSVEKDSAFASLAGGISFKAPIAKNFTVFGGAQASARTNWTEDTFNPSYTDFNLGLSYKKYIDTFTVSASRNDFEVNSTKFLESTGVTGQWQRDIDDANQVSLYGQFINLTYPGQSVRDSHRKIVGAGWGHAFTGDKAPVIFLSAYGGKEDADDSQFDYLASDTIWGLRAGGQLAWNYKTVAFATSSYEHRSYDGTDPSFLTERTDRQFDVAIGLRYTPLPGLTIKPQISYLNNDSNITLFGYDRTVLSVNLRKDFNW